MSSKINLKNGKKIEFSGKYNVNWQESFETIYNEYFNEEIKISNGDTIFDVGANVGLFSLNAYNLCDENLNCFAFEPIPSTYSILEENFNSVNNQALKAFQIGLYSFDGDLTFNYYPFAPCLSTSDTEYVDGINELVRNPHSYADKLNKCFNLEQTGFNNNDLSINRMVVAMRMAFRKEEVTCKVRKLSSIINEHNVQKIDLLKIDGVGCELEVLSGINEEDWKKIRQLLIKVRKSSSNYNRILELLKSHNYRISINDRNISIYESMEYCVIYAENL